MDEFVEALSRDAARKIIYVREEHVRLPKPGPFIEELNLPEPLISALKSKGINRLYSFQAKALSLMRFGKSVSIVAGTGTGKTEAFLLPILEEVMKDPFSWGTRALIVYPTKALARDQLSRIHFYLSYAFGSRAAVLDGDVSERERQNIYSTPPHILVTNPDMIHMALQYSENFRRLISGISYVVFDDAHVYSGVFGTHVRYVIRRLKRFVGNVVFAAASATMGNPKEFAEALFGCPVEVVDAGRARKGEVVHVMVKPQTRSKMAEVLSLLKECIEQGMKTLVFVDSHRLAELLKLAAEKSGLKVGIHRAGLKPEERRRVENALKTGSLNAVIATPTLELGIDIGDLDAVILSSIPPSFSKYAQRTGRVGRRGQKAYVITVLGNDPISAYYENSPQEFFDQGYEPQVLDPENEEIAKIHLLAMARDKPYSFDELSPFEKRVVSFLLEKGYLRQRGHRLRITREGTRYLATRQSLRGLGNVVKISTKKGRVIGYREMPMALKELHPGAVYIHGGQLYLSLLLDGRRAVVEPLPRNYPFITKPLYYSQPEELRVFAERVVKGFSLSYLELAIRDSVYGYVVKRYPGMEYVREVILDREYSYTFKTKGILVWRPPKIEWDDMSNAEAFHAAEHALISAAEMIVGASPTDIGGISFPSGHIYIYDAFPGGSGLSKEIFNRFVEVAERALSIVSNCTCRDGCPRCIYSPYCGNNNRVLSRRKSALILEESLKVSLEIPVVSRYGKPIV